MGLKLKKEKTGKTTTVKKKENEVELKVNEIKSEKSIEAIAQYEIVAMLNRLKFLASDHNLVPVIENFRIKFEKME